MSSPSRYAVCLVFFLLLLTACTGRPVRNLASDAALIKAGQSSRQDVLAYLGDPDEQLQEEGGREQWIYHEKEKSKLKTTPVVGKFFNPKKEETLTVILQGDAVLSSFYGAFAFEQKKWADDFDWQRKK